MANKYEGRVVDLESRMKVKPDVHERLADLERAIAHMPKNLQHDRKREFYLHCTDAELEELMGLGPNPPLWQVEALVHGATPEDVLAAADEKPQQE
jgi:hypothetical protein